jgi:hypothetical protein
MVGSQTAVVWGKPLDQFTVIKRPGRIAVQHHNGLALTFLDIMVAMPSDVEVMAFKWIEIGAYFSHEYKFEWNIHLSKNSQQFPLNKITCLRHEDFL